jgi:hypothetical protein
MQGESGVGGRGLIGALSQRAEKSTMALMRSHPFRVHRCPGGCRMIHHHQHHGNGQLGSHVIDHW